MRTGRMTIVHALLGAAVLATALAAPAQAAIAAGIPGHPKELKYKEFNYEVPKADTYRFKLKNGIVAYVAEDRALPLVNITVLVRSGAFLEPAGKTGLASLTATVMRSGGTAKLTAEEFDEKADFLAADISASMGDNQGRASLNCLSRVLDPALDLFFDMMREPRFQESRLDVEKSDRLEQMKQRNDDAGNILRREWNWLIYGEKHFSSRQATSRDLDAIARQDLIDFHKKNWRPDGMVLAISGDVDTKAILANLERRFDGWKAEGPAVPWPPAGPEHTPKPGLYHVEKDIPQGKVYIGGLGSRWDKWDNPDNYALMIMNDILGGGGFTSRITKKVRSDEGLAYSAGSTYGIGTFWPGDFRVSYQSKSATVALAAKLSLAEIQKLRAAPPSDEELRTSKASFIDTFPSNFDSPSRLVGLFAGDDFIGRPHSYWENYRDNMRKVTAADVTRVAKKYLRDPDQNVFLIVGKWAEIEKGDADGRATMKEFFGGKGTMLPMRDPLTLEPMK